MILEHDRPEHQASSGPCRWGCAQGRGSMHVSIVGSSQVAYGCAYTYPYFVVVSVHIAKVHGPAGLQRIKDKTSEATIVDQAAKGIIRVFSWRFVCHSRLAGGREMLVASISQGMKNSKFSQPEPDQRARPASVCRVVVSVQLSRACGGRGGSARGNRSASKSP